MRHKRRHGPLVMLERAKVRHQKALRRLALAKTLEAKWRKRITYYQSKTVADVLLGKIEIQS